MRKYFIILAILQLTSFYVVAQTDNDFWFVVPEVTWQHVDNEQTLLHFSATGADATVTIDMPKDSLFIKTKFTIPANGTKLVDLTWYIRSGLGAAPYDILTTAPTGTHNDNNILESGLPGNEGKVENRGIHISSTALITVYLERNATNNPDIWALKGKNSLGTNFYVPSQNFWNNHTFNASTGPEALNAIDIVATEDTKIYFTAPAAVKNLGTSSPAGGITLLKGQSISLVASDEAFGKHLGGTHIWSTGKIAVQWKDDSVNSMEGGTTNSGCYDLMGDQIIPTKLAGDEYIVMRGELNDNREYVFVMSLSDGTQVDLSDPDGYAPDSIILGPPGSISRILINNNVGPVNDPVPANPSHYIDALHLKSHNGEPFIVYHVTGFGCEMGAAILPTIKGCTGSTEVSFQRSTGNTSNCANGESFFLNIMCKAAHISNFIINISGMDYNIPSSWFTAIPGTGWYYLDKSHNDFTCANGLIPMIPLNQVTKVRNTSGLFHLGLINGGSSSGCRYGYFSDFSDNFGSAYIASSGFDFMTYCYGDTIQLQSSGGISYGWEYTSLPLITGTFVDSQNISTTRIAPPPGYHTYTVTINRTCYLGSDADTTITVAVNGYPEITAAFDTTQIGPDCCSPYYMKYINQSVGANKYEWTFERLTDTLYNSIKDPEVIYFSNKNYTTKYVKTSLKVSYSKNCPDSTSKIIPIKPEITAYGSKGAKSGCQQDITKDYTIDTVGSGPITSVYWSWGDGDTEEIKASNLVGASPFTFTHTFENLHNYDTTYFVTLVFIDSVHDCRDTLTPPYMDTVYVAGVARAKFTLDDDDGCSPFLVNFENHSNGDVTYAWDFGDGGPLSTSGNDTSITYTNTTTLPKDYYINLTITKTTLSGFCYDTYLDTVTVYPQFSTTISPPGPLQDCDPLTVDFSQTTTPAVPNLQYEWNFGNGATSGNPDPTPKTYSHTLGTDQNYQVTLITTSAYNCKDTAPPVDVTVYAYVDAKFTVSPDTSGCSPFTVNITNNSHINSVKNFLWNIDSGTGTPDNTIPFDVLYQNTSTTNITQTITLDNTNGYAGCEKSFSKTLTIYPETHASFTKSNGTSTICSNTAVTFINESYYTNPADKITGAAATYYWDFGDGTTSSLENPIKLYNNTTTTSQNYNVKLTLTVNDCQEIYTDIVSVYPKVKAILNTANVNVCSPATIVVNNTSLGGTSYLWQFSDGTADITRNDLSSVNYNVDNSTPNSVIHSKIYLTASNTVCTHKDSITLNVFPHLEPKITPDVTSGCGPLVINLKNNSTGGDASYPITYNWTFGDGENSTSSDPIIIHTFSNRQSTNKTYTVVLKATNSVGCINSYNSIITVFPEVNAEFTFKKNTECSPMPVFMDNSSLNGTLFHWDFGFDANTLDTVSNGDFYYNFYHTGGDPNLPDTYNIQLIAVDENHPECTDTIVHPITINPPVVADFNVSNNSEGCSPLNGEFTNNSTGKNLTFVWDYNDQNTSANSDAVHYHTFENLSSANKTYIVKLTAYDENGCVSTITQTVTAYPKVVADFTFTKDLNQRCTPYPVHFSYPQTAINGNMYSWNFGFNGNTAEYVGKQDFDFTFDNNLPNTVNTYTIQLISTDTVTGCGDTLTRPIEVYPRLIPNFITSDNIYAGCNPLTLQFKNQTTGIATYLWNFNDEQTSPNAEPTHIFSHFLNQSKDFNVKLIASQNATGCVKDTSRTVTVYSYLNPKFGLIQADSKNSKAGTLLGGCSPFDVQVTDSSQCNGIWHWDFGYDGISNIDENSSPKARILTYRNEDNDEQMQNIQYTIKLTVENPQGCTQATSQSLEVYPRSIPDFNVMQKGCHPLSVDFTNNSVVDDQTEFFWKLGDGATAVDKELKHTYFNNSYFDNKVFNVCLISTTSNLCTDSLVKTITVYPKPLAAISPEVDRGCSPLTASLKNVSKATKPTYYWDFDNGENKVLKTITTEQPEYINNTGDAEIKKVELIVESAYGCTDTVVQLVNVYPKANADFGYFDPSDTAGCSPLQVEFLNLSNTTSTVFQWDFGNGATSQLKNPTYRFINDSDNDKVFTVTLNVESPFGCQSSVQKDVTVYLSPNAEFLALDPIKLYPDTIMEFQNLVKPGPWTFDWNYGDGQTSHATDNLHTHTYAGWGPRDENFSYTVWLKAYSDYCRDSIWQFVTINPPKPYINIVKRNPLGCEPLGIDFNVTYAFGYQDSISWNFGNGDTSHERDPYYVYENDGVYISTVTIKGDGGIFIDTTKIYVYPLPEPSFEFRPDFVMLPDQPVQFFNTTYMVDKSTYLWNFGDGTTSTEQQPWHQYTAEGVYDIKMVATTDHSCMDSVMSKAPVTVSGEGYIKFPNAFLPSSNSPSDGSYTVPDISNNVFHPVHDGIKSYELWIFNRWGEQVFYSDDILAGWNGRYGNNGAELGQDVYFWKTKGKFNNDVPFKKAGDVTLIRK